MADGEQDKDQKTEDPTQKRLEEALKKGQVPVSKEVGSFFILMTLAFFISLMLPYMLKQARLTLLPFIQNPEQFMTDHAGIGAVMRGSVTDALLLLLLPFAATVTAALAGGFIQHGLVISAEPLIPKLEKISPMRGFKRLFSMQSVVELIKGIIKITIVGIICYMAVSDYLPQLKQLQDNDALGLLIFLSKAALKLIIWVCVAMFFIMGLDIFYQRYKYFSNLRMSKQEVKDEYKQSEGDPLIKHRLKKLRMERAQKRMMAEVPNADVVITNPTHYAVALKYESGKMAAPTVVAKGIDFLALTMRKIAEENDVTIVENPPLARALYASVKVDHEIPFEHYKAVAEIISYVYKLKGKHTQQIRR